MKDETMKEKLVYDERFKGVKIWKMQIFEENKKYGHSIVCETLRPLARIKK